MPGVVGKHQRVKGFVIACVLLLLCACHSPRPVDVIGTVVFRRPIVVVGDCHLIETRLDARIYETGQPARARLELRNNQVMATADREIGVGVLLLDWQLEGVQSPALATLTVWASGTVEVISLRATTC